MATFVVTDMAGNEVKEGDAVTDFRGDQSTFICATRAALPGRSAQVRVRVLGSDRAGRCPAGSPTDGEPIDREYYAEVFSLTVTEITD